jgi:predicted butyrate kinase (DUF1464 family)
MRVAGTDPGTSSLDVIVLDDGAVRDQCRFLPEQLQADPSLPVEWLRRRGPFDLIAGPSGYGLPLVRAEDCTDRDIALMTLVRPGDTGRQGVAGFSALLRELRKSGLPVVFLPGVIHLPTVPAHRKINRIDLGTADKLCAAALALNGLAPRYGRGYEGVSACVVELGSAFTACVVIDGGRIVDGLGGTAGPVGWGAAGAWDGEVAYLLSPLEKRDLFAGGAASVADPEAGRRLFRESLLRAVAGLWGVTRFGHVVLSGRLTETQPDLCADVAADLTRFGEVVRPDGLSGAWVKAAAQGAALLADGLAGGRFAPLVDHLRLRDAAGTILDWLCHPRASQVSELLPGADTDPSLPPQDGLP